MSSKLELSIKRELKHFGYDLRASNYGIAGHGDPGAKPKYGFITHAYLDISPTKGIATRIRLYRCKGECPRDWYYKSIDITEMLGGYIDGEHRGDWNALVRLIGSAIKEALKEPEVYEDYKLDRKRA